MAKKQTGGTPGKPSLRTALIAGALAAAAGFGAVYGIYGGFGNDGPGQASQSGKPASSSKGPLAPYSKGKMVTFVARAEPRELPEFTFVTGDGTETSLKDWRGKVVLLNLWATWCGPCREEMPALDRLKAERGGENFDVVALSIDRTGLEKPRKFLADVGIKNLELYNNSSGKLAASLKAFGMPTTLLIDRQGREIGRMVGPAEWDSEEAFALVDAAIAENSRIRRGS